MAWRLAILWALLGIGSAASAQVPAILSADGELLGNYLGGDLVPGSGAPTGSAFRGVSRTGFTFLVDPVTGDLLGGSSFGTAPSPDGVKVGLDMYFSELGCSGQAYIERGYEMAPAVRQRAVGGFVFRMPGPPDQVGFRYMVPRDAPAIPALTVQLRSLSNCRLLDGTFCNCQANSPGLSAEQFLTPVDPNDPAVSGVSNLAWSGPARVEVVPFNAFIELFCDGFEAHPICAGR
jgi:hypothetical protein